MRSVASQSVFLLSIVCFFVLGKLLSVYGCLDTIYNCLEVKVTLDMSSFLSIFMANLNLVILINSSFLLEQNECQIRVQRPRLHHII